MKKNVFLVLIILMADVVVFGKYPLITNTLNRTTTTLNGQWHIIVDPYETGYLDYRNTPYDEAENPWGGYFLNQKARNKSDLVEYDFDRSQTMMVPGDWNTRDDKLFYYEGTIWYKRSFDYKKEKTDNRLFVYFGAANYEADVYLNGNKLGRHIGGFTPFNFEITDDVKEKDNHLIIKVDNKRKKEAVPTVNTDWWNYGGLTRDVKIIEVPPTFILDYKIQLKGTNENVIAGFIELDGTEKSNRKVIIDIPSADIHHEMTTDGSGLAGVNINASDLELWSPGNPKLYDLTIQTEGHQVKDKIGFRTIETRGRDILLNGQPVFLRGICLHEVNVLRGNRAYCKEDAEMLLGWVNELNANFVRLAHYPHNEYMAQKADEMGILLWEEIPVYWTIDWENESTLENAKNQLNELITRDKNRASVIIWSVGNETPVIPVRLKFMTSLIETARKLDNTRLVSAALEQHGSKEDNLLRLITDPLAAYVDVLSFNEYIGWYDGLPEKCDRVNWHIDYDKPVIITEFGAGALQGYHGDSLTRWTEEYQVSLYEHTLNMLRKIPQWRGVTPWILTDFRSPRRVLPDIQDGWNRKGLIAPTGERKKAFYILQNYYRGMED